MIYGGQIDQFAGGKITMWMGKSEHIGLREIDEDNMTASPTLITVPCMYPCAKEVLDAIGLLDPVYFCIGRRQIGYGRRMRITKYVQAPKSGIRSLHLKKAVQTSIFI